MTMLRIALAALLVAATPLKTSSPMHFMSFLLGRWTCTFQMNGHSERYEAVFSYALGGVWLRETDTWANGGDEMLLTYVPDVRRWRSVVVEQDGGVTLFEARGANSARIIFHSIHPDNSMVDSFERDSPSKYLWRFRQTAQGKVISSSDICTKR